MRAFRFARTSGFDLDACRRAGIHAPSARAIDDTCRQLLQIAEREGLTKAGTPATVEPPTATDAKGTAKAPPPPDPLQLCLAAGVVDQLAQRTDAGALAAAPARSCARVWSLHRSSWPPASAKSKAAAAASPC